MIQGQPFHDVSVSYDGLGRTMVSWKLDPRFDDPFPHVFSLEFARSQSGFDTGELQVLDEGDRVPFLTDRVFRDASISSQAYYRVRLKTPAGEYVSRNKGLEGNIPGVNAGLLKELIRKENLVLRKERGGVQGYLFKRRYYGPVCRCTDKNTGILVSSACLKCAGTGYIDGYFPGVPFPVLIENQETRHSQITQIGTADVRELVVRCLANPTAEAKDIWMEADTSRVYEVREYSVVGRMAYYPVASKLQMRELPLTDTISLIVSSTRDPDISVDVIKSSPLPGPTGIAVIPPQRSFTPGTGGGGGGSSGAAGGDLSGTYPNPTVVGLQGRLVSPNVPAVNNVLTWNGLSWVPAAPVLPPSTAGGDLSGTYPNPTVAKIQNRQISATAPTQGQVLTWDSAISTWVPSTILVPDELDLDGGDAFTVDDVPDFDGGVA